MARSRRAFSEMDTVIGTWRSASENLALFCAMSPRVAIRTVCYSAAEVTPRSAARSKRGLMMISGRTRSPATRGARNSFRPCISSAILLAVGVENVRIVAAKEEHDIAPARSAALALEVDAGVGDLGQSRGQRSLEIDAGLLAVLLEDDVQIAVADKNALEDAIDVRVLSTMRAASATFASVWASVDPAACRCGRWRSRGSAAAGTACRRWRTGRR